MNEMTEAFAVLSAYPDDCRPDRIEPLESAGGFSGGSIGKVTAPRGTLCLRRWPRERRDGAHIETIHSVLRHVYAQGFQLVPVPIAARDATTLIESGGCYWELSPWMPGEATFHADPNAARLAAAMQALARFHLAAATFSGAQSAPAPSPGIALRLARLRELRDGGCAAIEATLAGGRLRDEWLVELLPTAQRALELFRQCAPAVESQLVAAAEVVVPLQACIRDIWHEHVLFTGNQVSGIIDFGAMRTDCVATDVTRLLGSLVGDDAAGWKSGIEAYCAVRPLSPAELSHVPVFDLSGVLLSPMNWLQWLYVDRRQFARRERVRERLAITLRRLEHLSAQVNRRAD